MSFVRSFLCLAAIASAIACAPKKAPPPDQGAQRDPYLADYTPVDEVLEVRTVPSGAKVTLSSGESCTSPCEFSKQSTDTLDVRIEKKGYRAAVVTVVPHARVIPGSGASGVPQLERPKLTPNPVRVTLELSWVKR